MAKQHNWVGESVSGVPGTGTINLGGSLAGSIKFADAFVTLDTVHYSIEDGNNREIGIGTLTSGNPWTLARTTVLETLVSGTYDDTSPAAISLTGAAIVTIDFMADMPGTIVGSAITVLSTVLTCPGTSVINFDDSIPANTEGTEVMTIAYTPKYANSKLRITFNAWGGVSSVDRTMAAALYKDSGAAVAVIASLEKYYPSFTLMYEEDLTVATAVTFKIRMGPVASGSTLYINGSTAGAARFNGTSATTLQIEEIRQ